MDHDDSKEERTGKSAPSEDPSEDIQHRVTTMKKRSTAVSRGSNPKRMRVDLQTLIEDNPRQSGLAKRKVPETRMEFENECKRLRPEFDPEAILLQSIGVPMQAKTIPFFSIFTKKKRELNPDAVFKSQPNSNSKPIKQYRKPKFKKTLSDNPGASRNIMTMFRQQQLKFSNNKMGGSQSESQNWGQDEGSASPGPL